MPQGMIETGLSILVVVNGTSARRWGMRLRHVAVLSGVVVAGGCGERSTAPKVGGESEAVLVRLERCAEELEGVWRGRPGERAAAVAAWWPEGKSCAAEVFAGCGEKSSLTGPGDMLQVAEGCVRAYCGRFVEAPRLCGGTDVLRGADEAVARQTAAEFLRAKLALDLGVDRGDSRVSSIADAYARSWAVEAMRGEILGPLDLSVRIDGGGFTIRSRHLPPRVVAADASASLHDPARWDYDALERVAGELKARYPRESEVEIQFGAEVSMEVVVQSMDALAGRGCTSREDGAAECLFWQAVTVDLPASPR